ncbi:TPA: hypothetical protein DD425_03220 [Candidatus Saccharibacteria bacterium]|nr:hypothetical protein [Candidatus Saccharibacteria bacterium]|tara:strand:- start:1073 stop:1591 length:519 start_codon:yes stop_codon:yes gene_type:complete
MQSPADTPSLEPSVQPVQPLKVRKLPKQKHFLAVFFISFMWGTFGVDRMYLGKVWTGIFKLITFGGFGLWVIVDLLIIMNGAMRDKYGRELLQTAEYKKFAYMTVLIFAIVLGLVILINGILLILGVTQFITSVQDGTLPSIPGLDGLLPGDVSPAGLDGAELEQYLQQQGY